MIEKALIGMAADELRAEAIRVDKELAKMSKWAMLAGTEYGKFLLADKRERLSTVGLLYGAINMGDPGSHTKIARIQGFEEYLREDLAKLEDAESHRKMLASYAQECHTLLNQRLKARTETVDEIVSGATQGGK